MEASRASAPAYSQFDDPESRAAQQARLRKFADELYAEMSEEERAEADRHSEALGERSKHWPE